MTLLAPRRNQDRAELRPMTPPRQQSCFPGTFSSAMAPVEGDDNRLIDIDLHTRNTGDVGTVAMTMFLPSIS